MNDAERELVSKVSETATDVKHILGRLDTLAADVRQIHERLGAVETKATVIASVGAIVGTIVATMVSWLKLSLGLGPHT